MAAADSATDKVTPSKRKADFDAQEDLTTPLRYRQFLSVSSISSASSVSSSDLEPFPSPKRKADSNAQEDRPKKTARNSPDQTLASTTREPGNESEFESAFAHAVSLEVHPRLFDMLAGLQNEMKKQLTPQKDLEVQNKNLREANEKLRVENEARSIFVNVLEHQKKDIEREKLNIEKELKCRDRQMQQMMRGMESLNEIRATVLEENQQQNGRHALDTSSVVALTCATAHVYTLKDSLGRELTLSQEHKHLLLKMRADTYKYFAVLEESDDPNRHLEKKARYALHCEQNRCIMIARALESLGRQEISVAQLNSQLQSIQSRFQEGLERLGYSELPTV